MPTYWTTGAGNTATYVFTQDTTSNGNDLVWQTWISNSTTTSATATGFLGQSDLGGLLQNALQNAMPARLDEDQHAENLRQLKRFQDEDLARRVAMEAERAEDPLGLRRTKPERAKDAAKTKALELLCDHLDKAQIASLVRDNHFLVKGGATGKLYRVDVGYARNVRRIGIDGKAVTSYCAHPANGYEMPDCDSMLMQKLMLEISEDEFLKIANAHSATAEVLRAA